MSPNNFGVASENRIFPRVTQHSIRQNFKNLLEVIPFSTLQKFGRQPCWYLPLESLPGAATWGSHAGRRGWM